MKKIFFFLFFALIIISPASALNITAASGSAADIQAAVNQVNAAGGGIVYIPAGTFYWNDETVTIPAGVSVIGASPAGCSGHPDFTLNTAQTILHQDVAGNALDMFKIQGTPANNYRSTRISGIQFEKTAPVTMADENTVGVAIWIGQVYDFRVDHCTFKFFPNGAIFASNWGDSNSSATCYGVCDHNFIDDSYKLVAPLGFISNPPPVPGQYVYWTWGYGIYGYAKYSNTSGWDQPVSTFWGRYGPVSGYVTMYIEDNLFDYCRHSTSGGGGVYTVVRYNKFTHNQAGYMAGMNDLHGWRQGTYSGGRGMESYNNIFIAYPISELKPWMSEDTAAIGLRGGSGLFHDNTLIGNGASGTGTNAGCKFAVLSMWDDSGLMYWNAGLDVNQTYLWNNTCTNCSEYVAADSPIAVNVNYFLRAPNQALDGFTYTPYVYPHPMTLGETPTPPRYKIRGTLMDKNGQPLSATVTVYQSGVVINSTYASSYELTVPSGMYDVDVQFNFSGVSIKLTSVSVTSDVSDLINYVNTSSGLSFISSRDDQQFQIASVSPSRVLLNGTAIVLNASLADNTYYYSNGVVYLKVAPGLKTDCLFSCCLNELRYRDKPCSLNNYCLSRACVAKTACPYECCSNEQYLDKPCATGTCSNHACISNTIFADGFESGNFNAWTGQGTGTYSINVASNNAYHGAYSAHIPTAANTGGDNWAYAYKSFAGDYSELYMRAYVKFVDLPDQLAFAGAGYVHTGFNWITRAAVDVVNSKWGVNNQIGPSFWESGTSTIQANTYYSVELYTKIGYSGAVKLWVDGVLKVNQSNVNTGTANIKWATAGIERQASGNESIDTYIDDVVVSTSYIGP